jgi:hypothetical protein
MHADDRKELEEFAVLMATLGEVFTREVSTTLTEIYFRVLSSWTIDEISHAAWEHIARGTFFPKPVELIDSARAYRLELRKGLPPTAEEIEELERQRRTCIGHGRPDDPMVYCEACRHSHTSRSTR